MHIQVWTWTICTINLFSLWGRYPHHSLSTPILKNEHPLWFWCFSAPSIPFRAKLLKELWKPHFCSFFYFYLHLGFDSPLQEGCHFHTVRSFDTLINSSLLGSWQSSRLMATPFWKQSPLLALWTTSFPTALLTCLYLLIFLYNSNSFLAEVRLDIQ